MSVPQVLDSSFLPPTEEDVASRPVDGARWWARAGLVAALVGYSVLLAAYFVPAISHPDANGYWAQASLIVKTGRTWFTPESNAQYIGMHWLLTGKDVYASRYPPGLALLVGAVYELFGWQASVLVNPVLAVLTLLGVYLIGSRLTSPIWGLVTCVVLAVNSAFAAHALTAISHMPVACCLVWGIYLLMRWSDSGRIAWVFLAGFVLGCIPTIRYADSIVAIGIAIFLLMHVRTFPKIWKHYLAAMIGALLPVLPLLIRNQLLFGAFWRTGYTLTNEESGFGWNYFTQHALGYLQMLQSNGLGLMFGLGLIGLVWMIINRRERSMGLMLFGAAVPLLLVYMAYYWAAGVGGGGGGPGGGGGGPPGGGGGGGGGANAGAMRFLVPLVPLFVIAGVWAMAQMVKLAPRGVRIAVPLVVIGMQVLMYGSSMLGELRQMKEREIPLAMGTVGLEKVAADGDVVIADNGFLQHLDFVRKWKLADVSIVNGRGGMMGGGPPGGGGGGGGGGRFGGGGFGGGPPDGGPDGQADNDRPSPMQEAKMIAHSKLYTGSTEQREDQFMDDVEKWANGKGIYAIGSESEISNLLPGIPKDEIKIVSRIVTPKGPPAPADDNARSRGGRMGGGNGRFGGMFGRGGLGGGIGGGFGGGGPGGGGPGGGGGGMFGPGIAPGETIVIAKWTPKF